MPKRVGNLYEKMLNKQHIELAIDNMLKGKRDKNMPGSIAHQICFNKDYYISKIYDILISKNYIPSKPKIFNIIDGKNGKLRNIQAPHMFPDQIIHWCVMMVLTPIFLKGMYQYTCASVPGRGIKAAKEYLEHKLNIQRHPENKTKYKYYIKADIRKYFQNIDKDILFERLNKIIKDKDILNICQTIIYSSYGTGIPLGFYTSQWFANFYLQSFDHFVIEKLFNKYNIDTYVRYMDDIVILGNNKRNLLKMYKEMDDYLRSNLKVEFKENDKIYSIKDEPLDFIGYVFTYNKTTIRHKNYLHIKEINDYAKRNKFDRHTICSLASLYGFLDNSDSYTFMQNYMIPKRIITKNAGKFNKLMEQSTSKEYLKKFNKINIEMMKLKLNTDKEGIPLVIYDPKENKCKIVARALTIVPDR